MSWSSFLGPALQVAGAAAPLVSTLVKNDAANSGAAQTTAGLQQGANILSQGYDQAWTPQTNALGQVANDQLQSFNTVAPLIAAVPGAYKGALDTSANDLGQGLAYNANDVAQKYYLPSASSYTSTLGTGAGQFGDAVTGDASSYGTDLTGGATSYAGDVTGLAGSIYDPYSAAGKSALSTLQGISATPAGQLTPAQQMARDDYMRQSQGALAASGLRGAGRAGVASIDKGLAQMETADTTANQSRADQATQALLQAGELGANQTFGAGSAGALQVLNSINSGAGARLNAGTAAAQAGLNANNTGAANQNSVMQGIGGQMLSAEQAGSQAKYNADNQGANAGVTAANNLITATTNYMGQKAGTDLSQGQIDTNNIMGKAGAQASAAQGIGAVNGAVTAATGTNWGGALNTLGGVISADNKTTNVNNPTPWLTSGGSSGGGGGTDAGATQ